MTSAKAAFESQFVTFALGEEVFAVPVTVVREILDHEEVFKIPHGPDYMMGLRDVRGQGVPIVDLRLRLGMPRMQQTPHTRVLVLDIPIGQRLLTIGLVADKVFEVVPFRNDAIDGAPDIGVSWRSDYIDGVVRRDGGFIVIINLEKLFSDAGPALASLVQPARQSA